MIIRNIECAKNVSKKFNFMLKLKDKYQKEAIPQMMKKFGYKSQMAVPRIKKAVVNTGFGKEAVSKTGDELKKLQANAG